MAKHSSVVGGSSARLRLLCNASIEEGQGIPEEETSHFAMEGTALHKVLEIALDEGLGEDDMLERFRGTVVEDVTLSRELLEAKAIPALQFAADIIPMEAEIWLEEWLSLPEIHKDAGGIGDVIFATKRRGGLIDYKMGDHYIVGEKGREQVAFYLAGAILCGFIPDNLVEYEGYIFQPSAKLSPDDYVTEFIFTYDELMDFVDDLHDAVNAPRKHNPGDHCYGCKGKIRCKAFQRMLNMDMQSDIPSLGTRDLGEMLDMVPVIEKYIRELEAHALRNAVSGEMPHGYKLDDALGNRVFKDEAVALGALARLGVPAEKRYAPRKAISPAQAETVLKELETPPEQFNRFFKRHVKRPNNGFKLVKRKPDEPDPDVFVRLANALSHKQ